VRPLDAPDFGVPALARTDKIFRNLAKEGP